MGIAESSVRSLLNSQTEARSNKAQKTADFLKKRVDEKGMIDVGAGVELSLNVSKEKLKESLYLLEKDGYKVYTGQMPQVTNRGKYTTINVLCPPGTEYKEIFNFDKIIHWKIIFLMIMVKRLNQHLLIRAAWTLND